MNRNMIVGFALLTVIAGGIVCVASLLMPQTQIITRSGSAKLPTQARVEIIIPVSTTNDFDASFYSPMGDEFIVYVTIPSPGSTTGEEITAFLNGSSSSTGSFLMYFKSSCCSSFNSGPQLEYASFSRATLIIEAFTTLPHALTVIIFGFNETTYKFASETRIVNYTITEQEQVPGGASMLFIGSVFGGVTVFAGVLFLLDSRVRASGAPTSLAPAGKRVCSGCGQEVRSGQAFCDKCGAKQ